MSHQNPGVKSPPTPHPDEALQPTAPDFKETPQVPPLSEDRKALPVWLFVVGGIILFLSGSSFTGFHVFGLGMLDQGPGGPVLASASSKAAAPASPMDLGKKIYSGNCASCHQGNGGGQPGTRKCGTGEFGGSHERTSLKMIIIINWQDHEGPKMTCQ